MSPSPRRRFILRATALYLLFGSCWIFLSDRLLLTFTDIAALTRLSTAKGITFILLTGLLLALALTAIPDRRESDGIRLRSRNLFLAGGGLPHWVAYLFAVASSLLMLVLRMHIAVSFGERPLLILFMLPIILSSVLGGFGPGIVATLLCSVGIAYYGIPPMGSFFIEAPHDLFQWCIFVATGLLTSYLNDLLHRARLQAEELNERREQAQEELRQSEERFKLAMRGADDGLWDWDLRSNALYLSPRWKAMLGYAEDELAHHLDTWLTLVHPEDRQRTLDLVEDLRAGHSERFETEFRMRHKDGSYREILSRAFPARDDKGEVVRLVGTHIDMTERHHAALKMAEQASLLERTSRMAKVGGWRFTVADGKGTWTAEVARIHDVDPEQETTREFGLGFYQGDHRRAIETAIARAVSDAIPYDLELEMTTASGTTKWVRTIGQPVVENGRVTALEGVLLDISERKRAEAAVRESEARLRAIIDNVPDGIVHLSPALEVRWVNLAAKRLFTLDDNATTLGLPCHHTFWDKTQPCLSCPVTRCAASLKNETGTLKPLDEQGPEFEVRAVPILDGSGRLEGIIEIVRDTTTLKRLEEQVRQAQKMESVGTLAGGIAHDFNNILSAILGYGELALEELPADSPGRASVTTIIEAGQRAAHLTKDLLLFSRKQTSQKQLVDLNEVVVRIEKFIKRIIGEDILCHTDLTREALLLRADPHQLEQVLMNFATNARDAMPHGGTLTITTSRLTLDRDFVEQHGFGRPGNHALLTVSDSGKGMDKTTAAKIFEPFFTTKGVGQGTGLGLAVVYGIVHDHQGHINVYSEPLKGTVFRVYLPLSEDTADATSAALPAEQPQGGSETILLAEDEPAVRALFSRVLRAAGYRVIEAASGDEAVRIFEGKAGEIDMLLFDLIMPKMDGRHAMELITAKKPEVGYLFVSGYAPENLRRPEMQYLQEAVLYKPVSPRELLQRVRQTLDRGHLH